MVPVRKPTTKTTSELQTITDSCPESEIVCNSLPIPDRDRQSGVVPVRDRQSHKGRSLSGNRQQTNTKNHTLADPCQGTGNKQTRHTPIPVRRSATVKNKQEKNTINTHLPIPVRERQQTNKRFLSGNRQQTNTKNHTLADPCQGTGNKQTRHTPIPVRRSAAVKNKQECNLSRSGDHTFESTEGRPHGR